MLERQASTAMPTIPTLPRRALSVLAVVLACAAPARADTDHPAQPLDRWAGLTYAVRSRAAAEAQWYVAVAEQHEREAEAARRERQRSTVTATVTLDGDRFDRLAGCESGGDPTNTSPNGLYLGAFQFLASSYHAAGGRGDPRNDSYATQKSIAMRWASMTNPATQWPVCWPRSA